MTPWHARAMYRDDQARAIYEALRDYTVPVGPVPDGWYGKNWPEPDYTRLDEHAVRCGR